MTPKKDTDQRVTVIGDLLSYVLIYAPDFPKEDATSLEEQFDRLLTQIHALWREIQDVDRRRWLDLLGREVVEARASFLQGDEKTGRALIQSAEERLKSWGSRKKMEPTFIVGPTGSTEKA